MESCKQAQEIINGSCKQDQVLSDIDLGTAFFKMNETTGEENGKMGGKNRVTCKEGEEPVRTQEPLGMDNEEQAETVISLQTYIKTQADLGLQPEERKSTAASQGL